MFRRWRCASTLEGDNAKCAQQVASAPELRKKLADLEKRVARSIREFEKAMGVVSEKLLAMGMLGGELRATLQEVAGAEEEGEEEEEEEEE